MRNGGGERRNKRILILCRSVFGPRMSSPGIRTLHMAEVIARALPDSRVTLAIPTGSEPVGDLATLPYDVTTFTFKTLLGLLWRHDIVICNDFPPLALAAFPWKSYMLDYYTIYLIEWMELSADDRAARPRKRVFDMKGRLRRIGAELLLADKTIVANERQKDYYLGAMIGLGLIDPEAYNKDPGLKHLIEPAPHGVREDKLVHSGDRVVRGVYAGITDTDKLLVWNGGVLQWYDPLTLLRALAIVRKQRDDVKLVFVGGAYPGLGSMGLGKRFNETIELAKELGLYNNSVFFDLSWVPYDKVKDYMLEADIAICTYFDRLETHFSLRTRFVDVWWSELPLICTRGDMLSDMVREKQLGITVPEGDEQAVADAILKLCSDSDFYQECKRNIRANNQTMRWDQTLQPFVEFCRNPRSSALPKWRRTVLGAGAWAQWAASRAVGMFVR